LGVFLLCFLQGRVVSHLKRLDLLVVANNARHVLATVHLHGMHACVWVLGFFGPIFFWPFPDAARLTELGGEPLTLSSCTLQQLHAFGTRVLAKLRS
jgi:hypothetical protein